MKVKQQLEQCREIDMLKRKRLMELEKYNCIEALDNANV